MLLRQAMTQQHDTTHQLKKRLVVSSDINKPMKCLLLQSFLQGIQFLNNELNWLIDNMLHS
jgi:hypothetical protein